MQIKPFPAFTTTIVFFSLFTFASRAQKWFDLGVKGGYGPTMLINQNVFNDKKLTHKFSFGYTYGGKAGFNFNEEHEIVLDVMSTHFDQNFELTAMKADSTVGHFGRNMNYNSLDFMLQYRKNTSDGGYFEAGTQYSLVRNPSGSSEYPVKVPEQPPLNTSFFAITAGFGGFFVGSDFFGITMGLRLSYSLQDIMNEDGKKSHYPAYSPYSSYSASNPLSALLVMEINYDFGYFASASCGKKTKFLMF